MTYEEKKKKAVMIAVAFYIKQENANEKALPNLTRWSQTGKVIAMNKRQVIQQRGRVLRSA